MTGNGEGGAKGLLLSLHSPSRYGYELPLLLPLLLQEEDYRLEVEVLQVANEVFECVP